MFYRKLFLLGVLFLGMFHLNGAALPLQNIQSADHATDWEARFNLLDAKLDGTISKSMNEFLLKYTCFNLSKQVDFIRENIEDLKENIRIVCYLSEYFELFGHEHEKRPLFQILMDCEEELKKVFSNELSSQAFVLGLKIYLCQKIEALAVNGNLELVRNFLMRFDGRFHLMQMNELDASQEYSQIKIAFAKRKALLWDDMARFFVIMCEVFEKECVRSAVFQMFSMEDLLKASGKMVRSRIQREQEKDMFLNTASRVCSLQ